MASQYERCGECGSEYETDFIRRVGERRICSMCRWLGVASSRRSVTQKNPEPGAKLRAEARR
jgi:hypothetical protein